MKKIALLALSLMMGISHANAETQGEAQLSTEQANAGICIIAAQGIYNASEARQNGLTKAAAKKSLDNDLKELSKSFSNQQFLQRMAGVWYRGLDRVYQLPVMDLPEERTVFVQLMTEEALNSCLESLVN